MRYLNLFFTLCLTANIVSAQINFFPEELVVKASALNLRDQPDKSGKVVEKLNRGTALTLIDMHNAGEYVEVDSTYGVWLKVRYKSKTGYVFSPFVMGAYNLYQEGDFFDEPLPKLNWYGIYMRDSFADELRKIEVHLEKGVNPLFEEPVNQLKTNQKTPSKFIIGTTYTLPTGFAGNLGVSDPSHLYMSGELSPGSMLPIDPGKEMEDTSSTYGPTWTLAATGCAQFDENDLVRVEGYRLFAMEVQNNAPAIRQDLTGWVQSDAGMNPSVSLIWFGDLDRDRKPDAILQDNPYEMGVRISLFLSSKALPGEFLHKVCEYFYQID